MRPDSRNATWRAPTPFLFRLLRRNVPIVVFLVLATAGMLITYWYFSPVEGNVEAVAAAGVGADPLALTAPIVKNREQLPVTQRLAQSPGPLRIGLIAGHKDNDSGAVCSDGLTEAQVTSNIAEQVAGRLRAAGVPTEILAEFDPRLQGYSATALVSIHADSCDYINDLATGFKISGSSFTDSSRLSICVEEAYRLSTQLPYHPNSITPHMWDYHAFREIGRGTPAIIIEVGFLNLDQEVLTAKADLPITGLVSGILCFLGKEQ
ncbi:MAG: N-acetylmuramoyl-L-alanine amidase [Chloroflexi bacterium]|nr:N-acetylmuramoyl-L-alanine amidase [Chloroflexota bacterium]